MEEIPPVCQCKGGGSESPIPVAQMQSAFIRVRNEALTVIAMRVSNEDRSPVAVYG
jgi:hypothetical protein